MDLFETVEVNDFIEYFIFSMDENATSDSKLQEIYNSLLAFLQPITENYIWHKDKFTIAKVTPTESDELASHLHGILHFGDNIEDEWFVVYLLQSFSQQHKDILVKLIDSDGEFLLIETANSLPEWLQSESCDYQSFIYDGTIKIVPGKFSTNNDFISKVVKCLDKGFCATNVEENVTRIINKKVDRFNNVAVEFLHKSRVYIPAKVAALLDAKPCLIAPAITAFCERDIIDKKICQKMRFFPPEQMVLRSVTFTKFLFAMISHQKVELGRNSAWILPLPSEQNYKEHMLGYKITCGFEILASKCKKIDEADISLNKKWMQYLTVLERKGYFKNFIEGSKDYTNLEKQARNYFLENTAAIQEDNDCILNVLQTVNCDYESLKKEEVSLPPSADEEWMKIDETKFNDFLQERFSFSNLHNTDSPEVVSSALNKFLNQFSDIEGVETNESHIVDANRMDVDVENPAQTVSFDADNFLPSLEKLLDKLNVNNENDIFDQTSSAESNEASDNDEDDDENNLPEDANIKSYMDLMDQELKQVNLSENFASNADEADPNKPVNIDERVLTNILKSYEEEFGGSGPAGNLLHSIGLRLKLGKEN